MARDEDGRAAEVQKRSAVTVLWRRPKGGREWAPVQRCSVGQSLATRRIFAVDEDHDWHLSPDDPNGFRRADEDGPVDAGGC